MPGVGVGRRRRAGRGRRRRSRTRRRRRRRRRARRGCRGRGGRRWPAPPGRCGAAPCPIGPSRSAAGAAIEVVDDEPGAAVLVDQGGEVGRRRPATDRCPARRSAARRPWPGSGRGSARPTVSASTQRPLGLVDVAARSTWRAPVTCSSMAANVWPARSCSSRAMRRRSSATACSASARRARFELVDQPPLAELGATEGEHEHVRHRPRLPRDPGVRDEELGDQQRRRRQRPRSTSDGAGQRAEVPGGVTNVIMTTRKNVPSSVAVAADGRRRPAR